MDEAFDPSLAVPVSFAALLASTALVGLPIAVRWVSAWSGSRPAEVDTRVRLPGVLAVAAFSVLLLLPLSAHREAGLLEVLVRTVLFNAFVVAGCAGVVALAGGRIASGLGLASRKPGSEAFAGAGACLVLEPAVFGVMLLWVVLAPRVGIDFEVQAVLREIVGARGSELAAAAGIAIVVVPLVEELVFRGFLQPWLVRVAGAPFGIAAASVAFALLHGPSASVPIFVLSLFLGWLRWRTGGVYAPWAAHAVHNGTTLALALAASAQ